MEAAFRREEETRESRKIYRRRDMAPGRVRKRQVSYDLISSSKARFSECSHPWQQKLELRKLLKQSPETLSSSQAHHKSPPRHLVGGQGMPIVPRAEQTISCNISSQRPRPLPTPTTSITTAITHHHTPGLFIGNHKFKRLSRALYLEGIRREEDLQLILQIPEIDQLKILNDLREKWKISLKECLLLKCELERKQIALCF